MKPEFWTVRRTALIGAIVAGSFGVFKVQEQWMLGGDFAARAFGELVAYIAMGAIGAAVFAYFLPSNSNS